MVIMVHIKCRTSLYAFTTIPRLVFGDNLVPWSVPFENYNPTEYTAPSIRNKPWADPDLNDPTFHPKWKELDGTVNRKSYNGAYLIENGRPLNPEGRSGVRGRGVLGRWGPNHATDPIVTRWKRVDGQKQMHIATLLPILQFCAIQRRDTGEWAVPGGMVDPGEQVNVTLQREFLEEALNSLENATDELEKNKLLISDFFQNGKIIYQGYVDDPRNTDNAWMETVAVNFHDETGTSVGKFELQAGDDAKHVQWTDIDRHLSLYASHSKFIETVAQLHEAHW